MNVAVTASSGTPTGNVALTISSSEPVRRDPVLKLSYGAATASVATLPGGSYSVAAEYGGDGNFAASTSSPASIIVTPEPSTTLLGLTYEERSPSAPTVASAGAQVPFGSAWFFNAQPAGQTSGSKGLATGTVTFADGGNTAISPLNASGTAVWSPASLAIGAHSVTAAYAGDASYNASTSTPFTFTVVKATPQFGVDAEGNTVGTSLAVHVVLKSIDSTSTSVPPSGTVTVKLGGLSQSPTLTSVAYLNAAQATAMVNFTNVPAGQYLLSATYAGDGNWNAVSFKRAKPIVFSGTYISTATTVTANATNLDDSGGITLHAAVTGTSGTAELTGDVVLFANGAELSTVPLTGGSGNARAGQVVIPATALPAGSLQVAGVYLGDANYASSTSGALAIGVNATAFTIAFAGVSPVLTAGKSLSVPLLLDASYGNNVSVALGCTPSSASFGCAVSPASASVTGSGTATLTIDAFVPAPASSRLTVPQRPGRRFGFGAEFLSAAVALAGLVLVPRRRLRLPTLMLLALLSFGTLQFGCGGDSNNLKTTTPPPPSDVNTPAGNYSVLVTATSGGITHNAVLSFTVL
jgi:hypothetical protein